MAALTLNSQVGRRRGRDAEAVARGAGVLAGVLRLHPEDDEGAVNEDAHSELQVAAGGRQRRQVTRAHTRAHWHGRSSLLSFYSLNYISKP